MIIDPQTITIAKLQGYLQSAIVPRPIALVSTIDKSENVNLSPFSFFNVFSANPPILIFSPARRVRNNTDKHTLQNVHEVPEVVINMVNYQMVQQTSLSSCDYPKGVNEFVKANFTPIPSDQVRPPRVKESYVSFECKVNQVIALGEVGGAGNLVICEVIRIHIQDSVLDNEGRIDPHKMDAVARMGNDYYCRAVGASVFSVPKPSETMGIGIDSIPIEIRDSKILTGNNLGMLANVEKLPDSQSLASFKIAHAQWVAGSSAEKHHLAQQYLDRNDVDTAWKILLS